MLQNVSHYASKGNNALVKYVTQAKEELQRTSVERGHISNCTAKARHRKYP